MSVLRTIESKLESLFEGVFGRAFRTNVQPVELARKLIKEMDDHRSVSVSRVYVPNEYTIYVSPEDREQFASFEDSLREELQDYLAEHARRERYVLLTPPRVKLESDADLDVGVFGIATRLVRGGKAAPEGGSVKNHFHLLVAFLSAALMSIFASQTFAQTVTPTSVEPAFELDQDLRRREQARPSGGQFQCERDPLQSPT